MINTSSFGPIKKQIFLNSHTWKFDKDEASAPLNKGERVLAFKDPVSQSICVKFAIEKNFND
jgi:hypothetical protein